MMKSPGESDESYKISAVGRTPGRFEDVTTSTTYPM